MYNALYFPRSAEQQLLKIIERMPAAVVVGPRQIGKTSLTKTIRNQVGKKSIYLDLERPDDLQALNQLEVFAENNLDKLIILDEIQRHPKLFPELRSIIDRNRFPGRFILLGSASPSLIRDSSESLAGRISILELTGLKLDEVSPEFDFRTHWLRGGFPESLLANDIEASDEWRSDFIRTYVERDLPELGLKANPVVIQRLWTMLAHLNGQTLNQTKLANSLGMSPPTLKTYINFMEQAYLVRQLPPYFANVGKRLVKSPKVYLRDTGIGHTLLGIQNQRNLLSHPNIGASWENYVIEQLFAIKPRWAELYFYRTQAGAELDLVITRGGIPKRSVEIKFSVNPVLTKGYYTANDDLKIDKRFVVSPGERSITMKNGVKLVSPNDLHSIFE